MQKIEDLKEILTAIQDIGNTWKTENISLRKDRDDLLDENQHLRETCQRLTKQNNSLRQEISSLSEKMEQLIKNLRDEVIKEFAADKQEDFQKFVRDCLQEIRKTSGESTTKSAEPKPLQSKKLR